MSNAEGTMRNAKWQTKKIRLTLLLLVSLSPCLLVFPALAQDNDLTTFEVANKLYESGNFVEAADLYQQLADAGYSNGHLFYNLGNAYFASENYPEAILNYRRSLEIAPRNGDARDNLALARDELAGVELPSGDTNGLGLARLTTWLTLTELALMALVLWFVWAALWLAYKHPRSERQRTALQSTLIGLALLLGVLLFSGMDRYFAPTEAVVLMEQSTVLDAPGNGVEVLQVEAGAEVSVLQQRGHWIEIGFGGNDGVGWISADSIEMIQ